MQNNLKTALNWIESKVDDRHVFPVVAEWNGFYAFIAYVYKIKRDNKPSLWFIANINPLTKAIYSIKRICTY